MIILATTAHFAKAAVLSAPVSIKHNIGVFFTPLIGVVLPVATLALSKKVTIEGTRKNALQVIGSITLTGIGTTAGISAAINTLGEYMHFDYIIYDFDSDNELISQLLHTVGMEKITAGTIITSSIYSALVIKPYIFFFHRIRFNNV